MSSRNSEALNVIRETVRSQSLVLMSWSRGLSWVLFGVVLLAPLCEPTSTSTSTAVTDREAVESSTRSQPLEKTTQLPPNPDSLLLPADSVLQRELERAVAQHPDWQALVEEKALALGLVDLSVLDRPRYAALNGTEMLYAASLPKIGILLAAVHQLEEGTLSVTPAVKRDLDAMIRVSSNAAATRMINRVGGLDAVNEVLTDPRYRFYDKSLGGGLWVGKRYASDSRRERDPLEGLSHAATVYQVSRFYTLLAQHRLVSEARSTQMLDLLDDPGLSHKFVGPLQRRAPEAEIHRKSGSWRHWHADSALVWGPDRRYVVVALVRDERGARIVRSVIPVVERVLGITETDTTNS